MKKYIFTVTGMSCAMCENHINDAIRRMCEIKSVKSDRRKNETVVIAAQLDTKAVISAICTLGYKADLASESEYEKRSIFQHFRRWDS